MTAADFPLVLSLSLWRCRFVKCICSLRDQSLNPNISPSTDPSPSCIWPLPDPHSYLNFPSLSWCWPQPSSPSLPRKKSRSHPCTALQPRHSRADWGHLQAGVKQIRTRAKWISCLPLRPGGMCSVSPVLSCLGFSRWMLMSLTQRLLVNGIIYLPSSLLRSPEGRSARMCTGLLFIAGIHSE